MITDLNFKQIHEDNFNKYKTEKDKILYEEAYSAFGKSPKIVFSILQDINDQNMAKGIFNAYCKYLENTERQANENREILAIKDQQILKLKANWYLILIADIVAAATLTLTIIF